MNELKIFSSPEFGQVRTLVEKDKTLFCGSDVAKALGYVNTRKAVNDHCKGVTKRYIPTEGGTQQMSFVSEGDLYRLITHSKLPSAEKFERWVFDEVLPSIRRNGMYAVDELLENPDLAIKAFTALKQEREKNLALEAENIRMKPKEIFADAVAASQNSILVGDLAKLLRQNGVPMGQKRLFEWMRQNGYLMKEGSSRNLPTQRSMEMKLFEIKETTISNPDGSVRTTSTTKVTGKGQNYFVNLFLS